jgi:hypothetical protein
MVTGEGQIKYDNIAWPEIPTGDGENKSVRSRCVPRKQNIDLLNVGGCSKLMRHMLGGSNKLKSLRKRCHPYAYCRTAANYADYCMNGTICRWHPDKLQQTLGKRISPHDATVCFVCTSQWFLFVTDLIGAHVVSRLRFI